VLAIPKIYDSEYEKKPRTPVASERNITGGTVGKISILAGIEKICIPPDKLIKSGKTAS